MLQLYCSTITFTKICDWIYQTFYAVHGWISIIVHEYQTNIEYFPTYSRQRGVAYKNQQSYKYIKGQRLVKLMEMKGEGKIFLCKSSVVTIYENDGEVNTEKWYALRYHTISTLLGEIFSNIKNFSPMNTLLTPILMMGIEIHLSEYSPIVPIGVF